MSKWNAELLETAEQGMVSATRHLIYVEQDMRDTWMTFWQEAQLIYREGLKETDDDKRPSVVEAAIMKRVKTTDGSFNFRDRYSQLESIARQSIARERDLDSSPPISTS